MPIANLIGQFAGIVIGVGAAIHFAVVNTEQARASGRSYILIVEDRIEVAEIEEMFLKPGKGT